MLPVIASIGIALLSSPVSSRECASSDFLYEYTACNENGERWRVAVPRSSPLPCSGNIPPPQKGLNCSFTCGPGNYLDLQTQECRMCSAGTYSLGGGIRFDEFARLPSGFTIDNFDTAQDIVMDTSDAGAFHCSEEAGWLVRNTELLYVPSPCVSKLSFAANLARPGFVEYTYRMPTNSRGLSLNVVVRNEQCQSYRDEVRNLLTGLSVSPVSTTQKHEESNGEWQKKRIELRTGPNVISWTVTNAREASGGSMQPIVVARIDVVGIAFTRQCSACAAGTYSGAGAGECSPCVAGTFSTKGSSQCGQCPMSQYSGPKSAHCYDRPACRQTDFYPVTEPCVNGKTRATYKKVMPAVCMETVPGAAKLPAPEPEKTCPRCNPGMALSPAGVCTFCPPGQSSDGNACTACPPNTQPVYGYHYNIWHSLPPGLETRCEYIADDALSSCGIGQAWLPGADALVSAPSLERGIAFELIVNVEEGFTNPFIPAGVRASAQNPVGSITIVFDTKCIDESCVLYFIEDVMPNTDRSFYRFLAMFNGTQPRRVITQPIIKRTPARFMIAFVRSGASSGDDAIADQARVFSINVTNVGHRGNKQGGGAASCTPCALGNGGCVACEAGKYLNDATRSCVSCPPRTYSNITSTRVGAASCAPCGPNLDSDGTQCTSAGKIKIDRADNTTREFDISSLAKKTFLISGVRVFAREGTSYYHQFNISLFGGKVDCADNFDPSTEAFGSANADSVEGAACRVTALPVLLKNKTQTVAHVSPVLIATAIAAISEEREFAGWKITEKSLGYSDKDASSRPLDLHLFYAATGSPTNACPNGTALAVTLRCDPNEKKVEMKLLPACPDGTCDGCLYQAMIETSIACPLCGGHDYKTIRGECVGGHQTIHSIPQKHCVITGSEASERVVTCTNLTENAKLLIFGGAVILVGLLSVLCWVFKRNQRLEYKYMKLVESKGGFELPAAESCGIGDDEEEEEEEDRVIFSKGSKNKKASKGIFGRFGGASKPSAPQEGDRIHFAALENDED